MSSTIFFFIFIPLVSFLLLIINIIFAPHNSYMEKNNTFNCGFSSFLGQNRTQFSISFFIFALLFLLFDLEILLVYPYLVSAYVNELYGLVIVLIFLGALTLGFVFELGKKALSLDSKQSAPLKNSKQQVPFKDNKQLVPFKNNKRSVLFKDNKQSVLLKDNKQSIPLKDNKQSIPLKDSWEDDTVNKDLDKINFTSDRNAVIKPKTLVSGVSTLKSLVGGTGRLKTQFSTSLNQKRSFSTSSACQIRQEDVDRALKSLNDRKADTLKANYAASFGTRGAGTLEERVKANDERVQALQEAIRNQNAASDEYDNLKLKRVFQVKRDKDMIDTDKRVSDMSNDIAAMRTRGMQLAKNKADSPNYSPSELAESFAPEFTGRGLLKSEGYPSVDPSGYIVFPKTDDNGNLRYPTVVDEKGRAVYDMSNNQVNAGSSVPPSQTNTNYQGNPTNQRHFPNQLNPIDQESFSNQGYFPNQAHPSDQGYPPAQGHPSNQGYFPVQSHPSNQGYLPVQSHPSNQGYPPVQSHTSNQGYLPVQSHYPNSDYRGHHANPSNPDNQGYRTNTSYYGNTGNNVNPIVDNTNLLDTSGTLPESLFIAMGPWSCGFRMAAIITVKLYNHYKSTGFYYRHFCNKNTEFYRYLYNKNTRLYRYLYNKNITRFYFRHLYKYKFHIHLLLSIFATYAGMYYIFLKIYI